MGEGRLPLFGRRRSIPATPAIRTDVFNKSTAFDGCLTCRPLLAAARHLLGEFKVHGANLREPLPGHGAQPLHVDDIRTGAEDWRLLNALILFDDMSAENGGTRVVPGSHRWPLLPWPGQAVPEGLSPEERAVLPEDTRANHPGEIYPTAPAGSIVAINGVLWHGGTQNRRGARRRQLHLSFTRRELPQQLDQRAHLTAQLYDRLTPALRFLLDVEQPPPGGPCA